VENTDPEKEVVMRVPSDDQAVLSVNPRRCTADVRLLGGMPRLYIDNTLCTGNGFFGNTDIWATHDLLTRQVSTAAANGVHVHSVIYNMDYGDHDDLEAKYEALRRILGTVVDGDPDARIFLRVNVGDYGGLKADPDERMAYANGEKTTLASLASERWYTEARARLDELVRYIRHHEVYARHVFGYHLECGEWFQFGYRETGTDVSPVAAARFREWLLTKYGSDTALRDAWGGTVTLDTAQVPRDLPDDRSGQGYRTNLLLQPEEQRYTDYFDYINDLVAARIAGLSTTVKRASNHENVVLAFYGYYFDLFDAQSGHFSLRTLLEHPDIDGFASPVTYGDRVPGALGATSAYMTAISSVIRNGKIWYMESDQRTFLNRTERENDKFIKPLASIEEIHEVHRREFGSNMVFGSMLYAMDLMGVGWLDDNRIWTNFGGLDALNLAYARAREKPAPFDVALVIDETAESLVGTPIPLTYRLFNSARNGVYRAGVRFGLVELQDVLDGMADSCRLFIFANPYRLDAETMQRLGEKVRRDGKVSVFMYGFGNADPAAVRRLTGLDLVREDTELPIGLTATDQSLIPGVGTIAVDGGLHPRSHSEGGQTAVLGEYPDGKAGFVINRAGNHSVLFCGSNTLDPGTIREIARYAGCNVFCESDDVVMADDRVVVFQASSPGQKTIHFGKAVDVYDYFAGTWHEGTTAVDLGQVPLGRTRYLFYGTRPELESMALPAWSAP
jgi:hypothetical protein